MSEIINSRYLLQDKIGSGGMGIVYRASDRLTGETVALKRVTLSRNLQIGESLAPNAMEDDLRLALAHEFRVLAGLRHPHIISVLDYGFDEDRYPFFTMTYLPETKNILEAAQDAPLAHKIELIQQLLLALAYLHRRGVLHRDLKPDNVRVNNGKVRVLDFGLSATDQISDNDSVGTPIYMAPELFEGQKYSRMADLYAVGVLLYQMLSGGHPFAPFDHKFLDRVLDEEPSWDGVDEQLRPFLVQLLAKEPTKRPALANTALAELADLLGQPLPEETHAIRESYLQAAKFVGREAEMVQLTKSLDKAASGKGSAWLIGGESGVGKTRLISELRTQALVAGFQVLHGQAVPGRGLPYNVWRAPVRQLIATLPTIGDLMASVLRPLVPDIAQLLKRSVEFAPELDDDAAQIRLFTTIARLFEQAERPLLLILADLHWAEASLHPIPYLTRLTSKCPILILGSYRSDERPDLPEQLADMVHLPLPRLSPMAMAELSTAMLGKAGQGEAVQALLQRETEGNAFFAVEVVRALAEEAGRLDDIGQMILPKTLLPNGIRDIVQNRVNRLPTWANALLVKTAVAGRELELPLIQELNNSLDINEWLTLVSDVAILEVQNGIWQFSHGKIHDGLLDSMDPDTLVLNHQIVAQAIEKLYPDKPAYAARLAHHWGVVGNRTKEQEYSLIASHYLAQQYNNGEAIGLVNRAFTLTKESDLAQKLQILLHRERLYLWVGDMELQEKDLVQMLSIAIQLKDPEQQARVTIRQSEYEFNNGRLDTAIATVTNAVDLAKQLTDGREIMAQGHQHLGLCLIRGGRYDEAKDSLEKSLALYQELNELKGVASCHQHQGSIAWYQGDYQEASRYFNDGLKIAQEVDDASKEAHLLNNLGATTDNLGDYEMAQQFYERSLAIYRKIGFRHGEQKVLHNLGTVFDNQGLYSQAQISYESSLELSHVLNDPWGMGLTSAYLGRNAFYCGEYERAKALFDQALTIQTSTQDKLEMSASLNNLGMVAFHAGEFSTAYDYYQKSMALRLELGNRFGEAQTLNNLGHLHSAQGELKKAHSCFQQALTLHQEMELAHLAIEDEAGLAKVEMLQEWLPTERLETLLNQISETPLLKGAVYPFFVYLTCYEILAQRQNENAQQILRQAYTILQERASQIDNLEKRRSYLENVFHHSEIVHLFEAIGPVEPTISHLSDSIGTR